MTEWCSLDEAVRVVESGHRVFVQGACATPTPLLEALVARGEELRDVEITHLHTYGPTPYTDERWIDHFSLRALFVGENVRDAANRGRASYTPIFLSDIPPLFAPRGGLPINVAFIHVSPPDAHGYCSLGPSIDVTRAAVDHARHVVALVNPHVPRTHGESFLPIGRIDFAVSWDAPLYTAGRSPRSGDPQRDVFRRRARSGRARRGDGRLQAGRYRQDRRELRRRLAAPARLRGRQSDGRAASL
jgi:acyl-CoA hydrolase